MERVTAIQLAQRLGVDYVVAASLLKLMVKVLKAVESDELHNVLPYLARVVKSS